ncbi:SIR2 family protein [Rhizobacter sp. OV335]|uniref:SIR2 family protein n=1 Tax=Rhizobacter sp. OV335 TaxID=1500264 RepID=UPI00091147D0|nr:SIR2 family protein [Rhizobacter sp. OV335]SHM15459.1 SIR2-like domain-containing protein [Rhizobacter sp. OV335]
MATKFNADLVDDVARRRAVLFIGAGASRWAKPASGGSFKDWTQFLIAANAKISIRRVRTLIADLISAQEYLLASELLKSNLSDEWIELLKSEFQQVAEVSRLHKALIDLNPRVVVTTNFDKLIETAWSTASGDNYPTVVTEIDGNAFRLFRDDEKYLIKLHGSIDTPQGIVFDKTSYQGAAFNNRYYADILATLLLTHTFIFVGFSMMDPAVTMIVESAAYRFPSTRPHYIFQSGKAIPEVDGLWKRLRKLYVLRYSDADHHAALAEQLEELGAMATKRRNELAATALKK